MRNLFLNINLVCFFFLILFQLSFSNLLIISMILIFPSPRWPPTIFSFLIISIYPDSKLSSDQIVRCNCIYFGSN